MCFGKVGKVIVTLLLLPWLNNANANKFTRNSVLMMFNAPPQRMQRTLEHMGRQTNISNCKTTEPIETRKSHMCIMTTKCSDIAQIVFNLNDSCSWIVSEEISSLEDTNSRPSSFKVWTFGLTSVGAISLSGLFGGLFWPLINSNLYRYVMHILIGLAVGSLSATSLFQLIPEGFETKSSNEGYLDAAAFTWASIWVLYMLQVLSKITFHHSKINKNTHLENQSDGLLSSAQPPAKALETEITERKEEKKMVAYMIIFGDALHNFIDGMSIGAGYSQSLSAGMGLSIAIACEEFPHELGDFAILINSGMPLKKALLYNFLSACTAFGGLILGILMGEFKTNIYIFAFAGGLFLYISLADLMPELNKMVNEELEKSRSSAFFVVALQNCGTIIGVTILYFVSKYPIEFN